MVQLKNNKMYTNKVVLVRHYAQNTCKRQSTQVANPNFSQS
jgi:hypothetical protein